MIAALQHMLEAYFRAFDAGESSVYASFYAPNVTLSNGAGAVLKGPAEILAYYERTRAAMRRTTRVRTVVGGEASVAALLESQFTILVDDTVFSGEPVNAGDTIQLRSLALYELDGDKFGRITAGTIEKTITRRATRHDRQHP